MPKVLLKITTVIYLAIPSLIFLSSWLRWPIALIGCLSLIGTCYLLIRELPDTPEAATFRIADILWAAVIAIGLGLISGIGGYSQPHPDWEKHNALLKSLIEQTWPVTYTFEDARMVLVYYIAYYLPAALVGRFWGWAAANQALFIWSVVGVWLAGLWVIHLTGRRAGLLIFVLFSGLDWVGYSIFSPLISLSGIEWVLSPTQLDLWAGGWIYASTAATWLSAPGQALGCWLGAALCLDQLQRPNLRGFLPIVALLPLWSIFGALGLLPFGVAKLIMRQNQPSDWRKWLKFVWPDGIALILLAIWCAYYALRLIDLPDSLANHIQNGLVFSLVKTPFELIGLLIILPSFYLLEFALLAIAIWKLGWIQKTPPGRNLYYCLIIWLFFLPLFRYGLVNDLVLRASMPALFALTVWAAQSLFQPVKITNAWKLASAGLLVLGSINAFLQYQSQIDYSIHKQAWALPVAEDMWQLQLKYVNEPILEGETFSFVAQYVAPISSWSKIYLGV